MNARAMPNAAPIVTLYTKPGCHLCEAAEQVIATVRGQRAFDLVVRNILDDPADAERYRHAIPVVLVNGLEVARHRLSPAEFVAALGAATQIEPDPIPPTAAGPEA